MNQNSFQPTNHPRVVSSEWYYYSLLFKYPTFRGKSQPRISGNFECQFTHKPWQGATARTRVHLWANGNAFLPRGWWKANKMCQVAQGVWCIWSRAWLSRFISFIIHASTQNFNTLSKLYALLQSLKINRIQANTYMIIMVDYRAKTITFPPRNSPWNPSLTFTVLPHLHLPSAQPCYLLQILHAVLCMKKRIYFMSWTSHSALQTILFEPVT